MWPAHAGLSVYFHCMNKIAIAFTLLVALALNPTLGQAGPTQEDLTGAGDNGAEWLLPTHDYGARRFVPSASLNAGNAGLLAPVCIYQVGEAGSFQSNPLVHAGVMYLATPLRTIALNADDCTLVWQHVYQPTGPTGAAAQRGLGLADGLVVRGTPDGVVIALDALSGELVWASEPVVPESGESIPTAPLVYGNLVIVGPASTDRGWVAAFDLATGELAWKFDVIPGPGEAGSETWGDQDALAAGAVGGGSVWTAMTLDVERGALHVPVSGPSPAHTREQREGDNLYTNSVVVLDVTTGELLRHHQLLPGGMHGWDTTAAGPLFTTTVDGIERDVAAAVGKHGMLHLLDRETGELVYSVTIGEHANTDVEPTVEGVLVCPGYLGGSQWNGPAYSPETNLLYVQTVNWCSTYRSDPESAAGGGYTMDPPEEASGQLIALDASTGATVWTYDSARPMLAAVTVTAGNVVLTGELTGDLIALDATTGEELYRFNTGGAIGGGVIAYELAGRPHVAVMSGNQSPLWGSRGAATVVIFAPR